MVTANCAPRFKDRSIMSDSYVEMYMRAKKRHQVAPKCLFGQPRHSETDEFLLQHEIDQMKDTKDVYEKYDLSEMADGPEKDNLFPNFDAAEAQVEAISIADRISHQREDKQVESNVKFRPKIVTERDRPPANNLFVPIEKAEPSGAVAGSGVDEKLTDYWQTSKRRRSSNSKEDTTTEAKLNEELPQTENNVNEDENPQE